MKKLVSLLILSTCISCSWLHSSPEFEMERLSEDVISSKSGKGISITVLPVDAPK